MNRTVDILRYNPLNSPSHVITLPQYTVDITWSLTATYDVSGTYSMQITYGDFGDLVSDDITISVVGMFLKDFSFYRFV